MRPIDMARNLSSDIKAVLAVIAVSMAFSGCSSSNFSPDMDIAGLISIEDESAIADRSDLYLSFLSGQLALTQQDSRKASRMLSRAAALTTESILIVDSQLVELELANGDVGAAFDATKRALLKDPTNAGLQVVEVSLLLIRGKEKQAKKLLQEYFTASPANVELLLMQLELYQTEQPVVEKIVQTFLKASPSDPMLYRVVADTVERFGFIQLALRIAEHGLTSVADKRPLIPTILRLQLLLGQPVTELAKQLASEGDKEMSSYVNRIKDDPIHFLKAAQIRTEQEWSMPFRMRTAQILLGRQDFFGALRELHLLLIEQPEYDDGRIQLAGLLAAGRRGRDAEEVLKKVRSSSKRFSQAVLLRAALLRDRQAYKEGLQALESAKSAEPSHAILRAQLLNDLGDRPAAFKVLTASIDKDPQQARALFQRAILFLQDEKMHDALRDLERVVLLEPDHAEALNTIAYTIADIKLSDRYTEALALIERALRIRSQESNFLDTKAWLLFRMNRSQEAYAILNDVVASSGDDPVILEHMADILVSLDQPGRARGFYRQALSLPITDSIEMKKVQARIREKLGNLTE